MTIVKSMPDSAGATGPATASRLRRCTGHRGWWALALLIFVCAPATADPLGNESPGSWMSTWSNGPPVPGLEPSVWLGRRGIGASLGGSLVLDADNVFPPGDGVFSRGPLLELGARGARASMQQPGDSRAFSARLHLLGPERGAWLASSGFQVDHTHGVMPLLGAGAWLERGRLTFATQVVQLVSPLRVARPEPAAEGPVDTVGLSQGKTRGSVTGEDVRLLTGAETSVTWAIQRFVLQSRLGVAVGAHHGPARWGELGAAYRASPGLGLFMRVRATTGAPAALEAVTEPQALLGIQLAVGSAAATSRQVRAAPGQSFKLDALDGSRYRITLGARGRRVELSSDVTAWIPLAARRVAPDRWEVTLVLSPGVHRIAVRVDGGPWQPPAGLPSAPDGFGGEVGIITVQ